MTHTVHILTDERGTDTLCGAPALSTPTEAGVTLKFCEACRRLSLVISGMKNRG